METNRSKSKLLLQNAAHFNETKLEEFIVKRSNIPKEFLSDFFNLGGNTYGDSYKNINFNDVVKWLDVQKNHLKRLLKDNFKVMDDYTEERILIKNKKRGANYVSKIMLTPDCFKVGLRIENRTKFYFLFCNPILINRNALYFY